MELLWVLIFNPVKILELPMPIRKTPKGYKIDNVPGHSTTHKEAEERMKAIKANQNKR